MHISDGVLSAPVWAGGYIASAGILAVTLKKIKENDMPRVAVVTSAFFVASLIHVPLGPTSVHLVLNGLVGMVLGPAAFISIFIGLLLQALLFQHGGLTTIGINAVIMGVPALVAGAIFHLRAVLPHKANSFIFGAMCGGVGIFLGAVFLALALVTTKKEFAGVARYAVVAHIPVIVIEAVITGFVASFLMKVKPEVLK